MRLWQRAGFAQSEGGEAALATSRLSLRPQGVLTESLRQRGKLRLAVAPIVPPQGLGALALLLEKKTKVQRGSSIRWRDLNPGLYKPLKAGPAAALAGRGKWGLAWLGWSLTLCLLGHHCSGIF